MVRKKMKTRLLIIVGIIPILTIPIGSMLWQDYGMVCNNAVVEHLDKYSNVFEDSTTYDTYGINEIGLPFGVHGWNIKECVDFTFEQRNLMKVENMSPICQNAISDWVDLAHKIDKVPEDVARNMNISSMPEDVLRRLHIFSQDVLITEELLKQKNEATVAVLNNCDGESWTDIMNSKLRSLERQ